METFQLFKARGIFETISDAFSLFKQEVFKAKFLKVILPIAVALGIIVGYVGNNFATSAKQIPEIQNYKYILGLLALALVDLLCKLVFSCFSIRYVAEMSKGSKVSQEEVSSFFFRDLGWYIGYSILIMLTLFVAFFGAALISSWFMTPSKIWGILIFSVFFCTFIYYFTSYLASFFPVCFIENRTFGDALNRSVSLMRGHFWETFALGAIIFSGMLLIGSLFQGLDIYYVTSTVFSPLVLRLFVEIIKYILASTFFVFTSFVMVLWYGYLRHDLDGITSHDDYDSLIEEIGGEGGEEG